MNATKNMFSGDFRLQAGHSSDLPDFEDAFLCIAVEVGLEKRRYLLFASSAQQKA